MKLAKALLILLAALIAALPALFGVRRYRPQSAAYALAKREAVSYPIRYPGGAIDVNTATADELIKLHGVGEALAREIISERETNGAYYYIEDLLAVRGIGRAKLNGFYHQLMRPSLEGE